MMVRDAFSPESGGRSEAVPFHVAQDLMQGGNQARIVLDTQVYTLRITRAGKLILTK